MLPSPSAGIPTPSPAAGTKRSAASDLQRTAGAQATPTKRQATTKTSAAVAGHSAGVVGGGGSGGVAAAVAPVATMSSSSSFGGPAPLHLPPSQPPMPPGAVTRDQLLGRNPDQLIETIFQIQAQHQQYVATISAQYESINQQLNDLRSSLTAFYNGQASQYQAAASQFQSSQGYTEPRPSRPVLPTAPILPPQPALGPPRPAPLATASHPTTARPNARPPPQSPQASHPDPRLLPKQPNPQPPQTPGPPAYDYRTVGTVEEVWKEYREGIDGQPAIEELDANWGSRWRPEPRGRTWYSRRKVIWDKIKEFMAEGMDEDTAVVEVEKLRDGGTINKLIRLLQDERKDKGAPEDGTGVL